MTGSAGRVLVVATAALLAGCASTSTGHPTSGHLATSDHSVAAHIQTPAELAQQLLDEARVPPGAQRSLTSPTRSLRSAPESPVVSGLVVKERWWRVNLPLAAAYSWITHHQSANVSSVGSSSTGGPSRNDVENDADFAPPHLPATVNSAQLSLAVAPLTSDMTAIGAYAVVVQQPPRPQIERVPATVDRVTVVTSRTTGQPDGGQVLGRTTVTGALALALVRDFDALTVQPPGERFSCPMSFVTQTATFRAGTHVWAATVGICVGVTVNLDGHHLPTLDASNAFSRDLRAAYGHRFPNVLGNQPMARSRVQTSIVNH